MSDTNNSQEQKAAASIATPAPLPPKTDAALKDLVQEGENSDKVQESMHQLSPEDRNNMAAAKYDKYEEKLQKLRKAMREEGFVAGNDMTAILDTLIGQMQAQINHGRHALVDFSSPIDFITSPLKMMKEMVQDTHHALQKYVTGTKEINLNPFKRKEVEKPLTHEQMDKADATGAQPIDHETPKGPGVTA